MKYWHMATAGLLGVINRMSGFTFGLFDILGTPFRLIVEAIRWPMLDRRQKDIAALNLEKFDARLREQFRGFFNFFDIFGIVPDKPGSWGAFDWHTEKSGTDALGYTKDGKPQEAKTLFSKESEEELKKIKEESTNKNKFNLSGALTGATLAGIPGFFAGSALGSDMTEGIQNKIQNKIKSEKTQKKVSGRFDIKTGKAYINNQEVDMDEYGKFQNLSYEEKLDQYGIKESPNISGKSKSYDGLDKQTFYEEEGSTTTYIVSQKGSSGGGETSSGTNAKVTKMSEGLILSGSGGESNNSYDVLAKR